MKVRRLVVSLSAAALVAVAVFLGNSFVQNRAVQAFWHEFKSDSSMEGDRQAFFSFVSSSIADAYSYLDYKESSLGLNWDEVTDYYSSRISQVGSDDEFLFIMDEMVSLLGDGHTQVLHEPVDCDQSIPIDIERDGTEFRVTAFIDQIGQALPSLDIGSELVSIDGMPMALLWDQIKEKTGYKLVEDGDRLLLSRFFREYFYYFKRDGAALQSEFVFVDAFGNQVTHSFRWNPSYKVRNQSRARLYSTPQDTTKGLSWQVLEGRKIGYMKLNTLRPQSFSLRDVDAAFQALADSEGLIIDLRDNGGGDFTHTGSRVIAHLISQKATTLTKVFRYSPQLHLFGQELRHYPGRPTDEHRSYSDPVTLAAEPVASGSFAGKPVVLLVNEFCFSSADIFISAFADLGLGLIVGRLDRGHSGEPLTIWFPGTEWGLSSSSILSKAPSGAIIEDRIVPLDIKVPLTRAEIMGEADPILDAGKAAVLAMINDLMS